MEKAFFVIFTSFDFLLYIPFNSIFENIYALIEIIDLIINKRPIMIDQNGYNIQVVIKWSFVDKSYMYYIIYSGIMTYLC